MYEYKPSERGFSNDAVSITLFRADVAALLWRTRCASYHPQSAVATYRDALQKLDTAFTILLLNGPFNEPRCDTETV